MTTFQLDTVQSSMQLIVKTKITITQMKCTRENKEIKEEVNQTFRGTTDQGTVSKVTINSN